MAGGFLEFAQVCLLLDEMCLEFHPCLAVIQLGPPGLKVFLELTCFYKEDVCNLHDLSFGDGIT